MAVLSNKVEAVIAAAGFSSRAGGWKPAFDLGGLSIVEHCVRGLSPFCSRIIVVGGYFFNALCELLQEYHQVELVFNPDYETGMLSSVQQGFRLVREPRFFFIPGDYPFVSSFVYETLLQKEGDVIIPSHRGITGHPVLFQTEAARELLSRKSCASLREFVFSRKYIVVELPDPGILIDIDTEEDYRRAAGILKNGLFYHRSHQPR